MLNFRRALQTDAIALVLAVLFFPNSAQANSACSLVGMFDSRAKALCEAAQQEGRDQTGSEAQNSQQGDRANSDDSPNDNYSPLPPPQAPARGLNRYEIVSGGLFIDLPGRYPQGYAPIWKINAARPQEIITDRYNVLNRGPQGTATFFVRIVSDQGRPALEFAQRASMACLADIVGLPQVITDTPKRFRLANFRYANNQGPQCQRRLSSASPWQGTITLSANRDGDIALSLSLNQALPTGAPWFEFTARDLPFPNGVTPQMAAADIEHKQQLAQAEAARAQAAAAERAAAEAKIAALPRASPVYARQMADYVRTDALGWAGANGGMFGNHLDEGSVGNVRVYSGSVSSGHFILRAEYTYNGGAKGWVVAQYTRGNFNCIQFWDSVLGCRTLRKPGEGEAMVTSIITSSMKDGGSNSSSSQAGIQDQMNGQRIRDYNNNGCGGNCEVH